MHNMHNKRSDSVDIEHGNQAMRKSKSTSNLSFGKKKINQLKIEVEFDQTNQSSSNTEKLNGNISPNHRRRLKRSSINSNSLLSTIPTVHELMSLIIHKDDPPTWLKQTDLYHEYLQKCREIKVEENSSESPPHYHQQIHRKQRSNLHMYARSGQSWQLLPSPPLKSPTHDQQRSKLRSHSNESLNKSLNLSSMEFSTPLNVSIKQDPIDDNEMNHLNKSKSSKQQRQRRRQMLCKKKLPQNNHRQRRKRLNSVENHEPLEKKDSSTTTNSSENDSNTSTASSSIDHTSPSPTTTVSASSSHQSSPPECMRANTSFSHTTRFSSPLRIQTSLSPDLQSTSTQRRSTRLWAPSNFYLNPMWIIPNTTPTSSKRLLVPNSSSPILSTSESNKRPRRRCRS